MPVNPEYLRSIPPNLGELLQGVRDAADEIERLRAEVDSLRKPFDIDLDSPDVQRVIDGVHDGNLIAACNTLAFDNKVSERVMAAMYDYVQKLRTRRSAQWHTMGRKPEKGKPILMRGPSGYLSPHNVRYISGYYNADYAPLSPWRATSGEAVQLSASVMEQWCYVEDVK